MRTTYKDFKTNYHLIRGAVSTWISVNNFTIGDVADKMGIGELNLRSYLNGYNDSAEITLRLLAVGFDFTAYKNLITTQPIFRQVK